MKLLLTILLTSLFLKLAPVPPTKVSVAPKQVKLEEAVEVKSKPVEPVKPKVEEPTTNVVKPVVAAPQQPQAAYVAPTNASEAKNFIYMKESGNNPGAINASSGACSLGQALPCSKLSSVCPNWATDYACADAWFTKYMEQRYGSWENARTFWLAHRWW